MQKKIQKEKLKICRKVLEMETPRVLCGFDIEKTAVENKENPSQKVFWFLAAFFLFV